MIGFIVKKFIGSKNEREVKRLRPIVAKINAFEAELQKVSDEALRQKTAAWKEELSKIEDKAELARRLDEILPEAFAVVKNACRRLVRHRKSSCAAIRLKWEMVPFDVQLDRRHRPALAARSRKWRLAKAKRSSRTLPVYLNALTGRGVHVVTVNDYLAARDSEWMGAVYKFLGLTVGCILHDQSPERPPRAIRLRHHLRHERRVRFRLSARQRHGHAQGGAGPARPLFRHRGRSGLHPDR